MQTTKQQQILGYFIEEAKEHLDSIESGLLNLSQTMAETEDMNQIFRAAHSIKGGAAMLGFNSIQRVAHHLEDYFKLLKENPSIKVDRRLEDLFLKGFDALKALVDQLQGTFGLRDEDAEHIVQGTEPIFAELGQYLNQLIQAGNAAPTPTQPLVTPQASGQVSKILKVMLQLFKQGDNAKSRQQLIALCTRMMQIAPKNEPWIHLGQTAQRAIANQANPYAKLAPILIKELKLSSDLLLAGRSGEIIPSTALQRLTKKPTPQLTPDQLAEAQSITQVRSHPTPIAQVEAEAQTMTIAKPPATLRPRTISVPNDPKAAARALLDAFSKNELIQLAEFLMKSIQS
ncbi:Hpt domain-containing protein [filamentous cyanobacterium LEGE 11480]|uniref:Hpt domain-containing protein n=1 Tax=Romeriopsis navalis LEGE 11480 TaxID=2777977 RepID=A0A928VKS1_9CYAN|nr:Hpt domain-containing protein [Romeriopsis navalis]MBE9029457.1 Hpt domain-containing protein [Romeriopsis navalis LEGE 11480]